MKCVVNFASGQQSQTELRLYFGVCILQQFQQSGHRDGRFVCSGYSLRAGAFLFSIEPFLELPAQFYTRGLLDMGGGSPAKMPWQCAAAGHASPRSPVRFCRLFPVPAPRRTGWQWCRSCGHRRWRGRSCTTRPLSSLPWSRMNCAIPSRSISSSSTINSVCKTVSPSSSFSQHRSSRS